MRNIILALTMVLVCSCNQTLPYQDRSLSPEQRAQDLLGRLTLEEKASLMQHTSPAIERLGIKEYNWWNEALHGVGRNGTATVYPQTIGMAASFDDALLHDVFKAVSDEARAKNRQAREEDSYKIYQGLTFWTPNINIFRDPRWGRGQETYGEDPYLTSMMGVAVVHGLQGPPTNTYRKAFACAKHFAVHSGPEWNRHQFNAEDIDPRDLFETYLPAFKDLVIEGDVQQVMCAYNRFEGDPCCGSDRLLTQILRNDWGYKGIIVSDCWAVDDFFVKGRHETHPDRASAAASAVLSGTDLECGQAFAALPDAVRSGLIKESDIDEHVLRLLTARFRLGEMDQDVPNEWDEIPYSVISSEEHRALALQMAHESMVLLQNKNDLLPLKSDMKIAVIGANANDSTMQWGNYNGFPKHTETLVSALKKRIPAQNLIVVDGGSLVLDYYYTSLFDQCSTANGNGLDATYYGNKEYQGNPIATARYTSPLALHTQDATPFEEGVPLTDFSASYKTTLHNKQAGKVGFQIKVLGHYDLIINGDTVSSQDAYLRGDDPVYEMDAIAGKDYDIELRYNYISNSANLSFDIVRKNNYDTNNLLSQVRSADVVIYAGGISPRLEGEEMPVTVEGFKGGDRTDIQLPKVQREFLKKLKAAGKRVVLVNYSGSAVGLVPEKQTCDAILQAWYPGQEGGTAIVDVLLGDYNPSGRLPVTFYTDTLQIPDFQEYSMKGRTYRYMEAKPAFAFGYGLSYTTFEYGKAEVKDGALVVDVKNTGRRDGEEVVQLYIQRPDDKEGPIKTLRGFQRVSIPAGASATVSIPLTDETFEWWDSQSNTVRPLPGQYHLLVGSSSDDPKMQTVNYTF